MKFCCYTKNVGSQIDYLFPRVRDRLDNRQPITMVDRLMSDSVKPASIILEIFNLIKSRHILTNENHHLTPFLSLIDIFALNERHKLYIEELIFRVKTCFSKTFCILLSVPLKQITFKGILD